MGWVTSVLPSQHPGLGWAQLCSVPSIHPSVKGMSTQTIPDQSMCDAQFCPHSSTVMSQMLLSHVSVTRSPTLGSAHPVGEVPRCQGQGSPRTSPELTSQCGDPRTTSPLPSIPPAKCQQSSAPSTSHPRPDGVAPSSAIVSPLCAPHRSAGDTLAAAPVSHFLLSAGWLRCSDHLLLAGAGKQQLKIEGDFWFTQMTRDNFASPKAKETKLSGFNGSLSPSCSMFMGKQAAEQTRQTAGEAKSQSLIINGDHGCVYSCIEATVCDGCSAVPVPCCAAGGAPIPARAGAVLVPVGLSGACSRAAPGRLPVGLFQAVGSFFKMPPCPFKACPHTAPPLRPPCSARRANTCPALSAPSHASPPQSLVLLPAGLASSPRAPFQGHAWCSMAPSPA